MASRWIPDWLNSGLVAKTNPRTRTENSVSPNAEGINRDTRTYGSNTISLPIPVRGGVQHWLSGIAIQARTAGRRKEGNVFGVKERSTTGCRPSGVGGCGEHRGSRAREQHQARCYAFQAQQAVPAPTHRQLDM
jgi:hypothetical protein